MQIWLSPLKNEKDRWHVNFHITELKVKLIYCHTCRGTFDELNLCAKYYKFKQFKFRLSYTILNSCTHEKKKCDCHN